MSVQKEKIIRKDGKSYKLVPPDGGWGHMIAIAMIIVLVAITAPMGCFGIIYGDFLEARKINTSGVTLQNGLTFLCFSVSAFLTNVALKRFSIRQVGLLGAFLYCIGNFGLIFIDSLFGMVIAGSILGGSGSGLMMTCIYTAFNMYFVKKRVFYMSVAQTVIALATITTPPLISLSIQEFGFRGTLAIICGLGLHVILGFLMVQPVENHLKLEEVRPDELGQLLGLEPLNKKEREALGASEELEPLNQKDREELAANESKESKFNSKTTEKPLTDPEKKMHKSKLRTVIVLLELSLLQDLVFLNVCVGISITLVADITFVMLLPLHLYEMRWSLDQVAFMLTLLLIGDTVARVVLTIVSKFFKVNSRLVFLIGVFVMTLIRFTMFIPQDVLSVTALCTLLGFFRCLVLVTYPLVVADHVPTDKYPAAQGLQLLMTGVLSLVGGPATGALRDITGSYLACFHVLTAGFLVCLIPWTVELLITRSRNSKKKINNTYKEINVKV